MCHRFLPIDQYNQYQSNQIYWFLSIYIDKSIPIFIDWLLRVRSNRKNSCLPAKKSTKPRLYINYEPVPSFRRWRCLVMEMMFWSRNIKVCWYVVGKKLLKEVQYFLFYMSGSARCGWFPAVVQCVCLLQNFIVRYRFVINARYHKSRQLETKHFEDAATIRVPFSQLIFSNFFSQECEIWQRSNLQPETSSLVFMCRENPRPSGCHCFWRRLLFGPW